MLPEQQRKFDKIITTIQREIAGPDPLVVGPWTGEVGYETLYWIPFVRWALRRFAVPAERVVIVSRGRTSSWYSGLEGARYVDAFDLMSPAELASFTGTKPKQMGSNDQGGEELFRRTQASLGLSRAVRLLPHRMFQLYEWYRKGNEPLQLLEDHAVWSRFVPPSDERLLATLPERFIAVRFYFSRSLPDDPRNRLFAQEMVDRLAETMPIVMLNHPFELDDHRDYQPNEARIISVADQMTPANNLAVQTAVIGRSAAFVGTYGGLSLVPPLCGVPSFAFHSVRYMKQQHERAIERMIEVAGGASLRVEGVSNGAAQAEALLKRLESPDSLAAFSTDEFRKGTMKSPTTAASGASTTAQTATAQPAASTDPPATAAVERMIRDSGRALERIAQYLGEQEFRRVLTTIAEPRRLEHWGRKVYSQSDEDGILGEILRRIDAGPDAGILMEFGVENGLQCNTYWLMRQGYTTVWLEYSDEYATWIRKSFKDHMDAGRLQLAHELVVRETVDARLAHLAQGRPVTVLSIDVDGNDYWLWERVESIRPAVVVVEYNAACPPPVAVVQTYDDRGPRKVKTDYWGASLSALHKLARRKGYHLVACGVVGVNAFFVREDLVTQERFPYPWTPEALYHPLRRKLITDAFVPGFPPGVGPNVEIL